MSFQELIYTKDSFNRLIGNSRQGKYISRYLADLKAEICVIEKEYIDKGYMIDYQRFYSRSFKNIFNKTDRLHFFSKVISNDEFESAIINNKKELRRKIESCYLGFVIVKPIKDEKGHPIIGRTLLEPYPANQNNKNRTYLKIKNQVSFFGISLSIKTMPFQAQDQGVSACATIALWTVFQSLSRIYDIPRLSPSEISEISASYPNTGRTFPQQGLTLEQMITCFKSVNMDVEILNLENFSDDEVLLSIIKAFKEMGTPLVATLVLKKAGKKYYHAVAITGYQSDDTGKIQELYVHDDQIGPYCRVSPEDDFRIWNYEWTEQGYSVNLETILVPLYHKIRLEFRNIYRQSIYLNDYLKKNASEKSFHINILLSSNQNYKAKLINSQIENKLIKIMTPLPRYIWIIRLSMLGEKHDIIYDSTAVYPKELEKIKYI